MAEKRISDIFLWSPFQVDWTSLGDKLPDFLSRLAGITVPTIKWNPIAAEIIPETNHKAVLRIVWQSVGSPPLVIPAAVIVAGLLLFGIIVTVYGINVWTEKRVEEQRLGVIETITGQVSRGEITDEQGQFALGLVGSRAPTQLEDIGELIKLAGFALIIIAGGILILSAARGK